MPRRPGSNTVPPAAASEGEAIKVSPKRFACVSATALVSALAPGTALAGTITVDTVVDSASTPANCALREAVGVANTDANANGCTDAGGGINDTITFANTGIDPVLTIVPAGNGDDNLTGDVDVLADAATQGSLTIQGLGQANTTIEGGVGVVLGPDRLLDLVDGSLAIQGLTLTDGDVDATDVGGAIDATGIPVGGTDALTLTNVTVDDNSSVGGGGGVMFSGDTLSITGSVFSNNDTGSGGGAINAVGAVTISGTTIEDNNTTTPGAVGGGILISGGNTTFNMDGSTVTGNDTGVPNVTSRGGGLYFVGTGPPGNVTNSTFSANESDAGFGGGIRVGVPNATLNVSGSQFTGNRAQFGAGLSAAGPLNLSGSTVSGNFAETSVLINSAAGGGLQTSFLSTVTGSTLSGNGVVDTAANAAQLQGAAIANGNEDVRVVGSTITGNFFTGPPAVTFGSAITAAGGSNVDLINSTVSGNTGGGIGGPLFGFGGGTATVDIIGSTIAGNTFAAAQRSINFGGAGSVVTLRGSVLGDAQACGAGITASTATYNVDAGSTCPLGTGSVSNADALLAPLSSNGGPTQTRLIGAGSPAIDRLPAAACTDDLGAPLGSDQRGLPRPSPAGGACDAGAVELAQAAPSAKKCKKPKKKKKKKKRAAPSAKKKKKKKCGKKKKKTKRP